MWEFLMGFLFAHTTGFSRYIRHLLVLFAIGVLVAGLIYACEVLNAANERSHAFHDHAHSIH